MTLWMFCFETVLGNFVKEEHLCENMLKFGPVVLEQMLFNENVYCRWTKTDHKISGLITLCSDELEPWKMEKNRSIHGYLTFVATNYLKQVQVK